MKRIKFSFSLLIFLCVFLTNSNVNAQDWDLLWSNDVSSIAGIGQAGCETDGEFIYTSFDLSSNFAKFDFEGNHLETFSIPGVSNIKDLAYDGEYFYGSDANLSGIIYQMDFLNKSLVTTITVSDRRIRHLAYNPDLDAFWCGNWQDDLIQVNREGEILDSIPNSSYGIFGIYGSAFDNISEGGPYLWVHSRSYLGCASAIIQIDLATGTPTSVWHNALSDAGVGITNPSAGGLFSSTSILPGYFVLGGLIQGTPNKAFAYSLFQYGSIPPVLENPLNNASNVDVMPLFQWEDVENAVSYQMQISEVANFATILLDKPVLDTNFYQLLNEEQLEEISKYFWRVRVEYEDEEMGPWSKAFSFITGGNLPEPVLISPIDEVENTDLSLQFSWTGSVAATYYYLQISRNVDFTDLLIDEPTLNATTYNASGLTMSTQYWWRVKMINAVDTSDWSEEFTFITGPFFTVGQGIDYNNQWMSPSAYPNGGSNVIQQYLLHADEMIASGASAGFLTSIAFNVAVLNSGTPIEGYEIKLKNTNEYELGNGWNLNYFTTVFDTTTYTPVLGWNVHSFAVPFFWDGVSNLLVNICTDNIEPAYNESTYWNYYDYSASAFYTSYDGTACTNPLYMGTSTARPNMKFSLELPLILPPNLISPITETYCNSLTPLLNWSETDTLHLYTLQVATDEQFTEILYNITEITESEYQITENLEELTRYYWRVNAFDGINTSFWAQTWNFITEGELSSPVLLTPINESENLNKVQNFSWEQVPGATGYQIQIATDTSFESIIYTNTFGKNTEVLIKDLPNDSEIFWHVMAQNECSDSDYSETWSFTTNNIPYAYSFKSKQGFVMFPLNNPNDVIPIASSSIYSLDAATWANDNWYGVSSKNLITINTSTGATTTIGYIGVSLQALSYDVQSNVMYGISYNKGTSYLYSINLTTAAPTLIGAIGSYEFNNLAISLDGELYSICINDDNLYSINKTTGLGTIIGPIGFDAVNYQDMEFDKVNGVCYWLGNISDYYSMNFYSIDIETGIATLLNNLNTSISTIAIPYTPSCLPLPVLSTPLNKSTCIPILPSFDWNDVDSASSYIFQLSLFPTFETIYFEQENLTLSEIALPIDYQLDEINRYHWRVKAIGTEECDSYWSSRFSFITEGDLQNPVLVSPPNLALNYIAKPVFVWNEIIGAANYDFHLSTNLDFSDTVIYQSGLITTLYQSTGLELNTQYWWRVKTQNLCSQSEWSEPFTFTTSSNLVIGTGTSYNSQWDYPTAYGSYSPNCKQQFLIRAEELNNAGGAIGILTSISFQVAQLNFEYPLTDYTIKLKHTYSNELYYWDLENWTTVFGPVDYQPVAGWNTHNFDDAFVWDGVSNILVDICFYNPDVYGANIGTYYSYTSFVSSLVYYSYDSEIDACSSPNYPNTYSIRPNMMFGIDFTNLFPPQLQLPENNSICASTLPLLDWNDVQNATSYSIQLADNPNFEFPIVQLSGLTNSEYQLPDELILNENTEYYWRANASDGTTTSYWSLKYRFITEGDLSAPVLVFPANLEINCSTSFLLSWNSNINSETYHLQIATDDTLSNIIIDEENITSNEFSISGLNYNTQYWWRVSAQNPCSESAWSTTNIFTTGTHIAIGTDNFVGKPNSYPAPYANNTEGAKHQIYILADELYNADIASSMFNSLSFNVAELASGNTLDNFTISMKHSNVKNLDYDWDLAGWQLVYGPVDYTPNLGWNTHTFDYPFNWDGVSNILIDICFNNEIGDITENERFYISSTSFNSTRYYYTMGSDIVCTDPEWANLNSGRPNMRFDMDLSYFLAPKLISPAKSSWEVSLTPLFEWSNVELANSYSLQVSNVQDFSTILIEHNNLTGNSYQVTDEEELLGLTQYYWRVRASNNNYTSGWSPAWSFTTESGLDEQTISLNTGWNMISGYIVPSNPDITSIFAGMSKSLKLVKNGAGQLYNPSMGINTIVNWNQFDGYLVLMKSPAQINILGEQIEPEETPLNLLSGWNLSAYFRDNDMSPATALASVTTSLVLAKNNVGGIYMPSFGINTIGDMHPGQGYYFYMDAAAELTYPANSAQKAVAGNNITPLAKSLVPSMNNTGKNSTLIISIENNDGNEIGIYNMNDELIGAGAIYNGVAAITVWGDDDVTKGVDGANENEYLHAKLFKTNNNTMTNIPLLNIRELTNNTEQNALFYETNSIYFAKSVSNDESVFGMSIKNIPNPVENDVVFEFGLTEESNAEIQIYTSTGELIASIGNGNYSAGLHRINFDASNLASGMYNIVLSSGSKKELSFMIVNK